MTNEQIDDITEVVYRIRLEQDCQTNVKRMIEKDKDGGAKLRGRSRSYRRTVEAVLEAAGVIPPGSQLKYLVKEGLQGPFNAGARKRAEHAQRLAEAESLSSKYADLTSQIEAIDKAKVDAIANAKLPIPELSIGDDDIILDGLPFEQASTARKIRTATSLLMALKPELRVLLVREGSLLDDDAREALEAHAKEHGFVVLMECVGNDVDGGGVVIENGEVADNG